MAVELVIARDGDYGPAPELLGSPPDPAQARRGVTGEDDDIHVYERPRQRVDRQRTALKVQITEDEKCRHADESRNRDLSPGRRGERPPTRVT